MIGSGLHDTYVPLLRRARRFDAEFRQDLPFIESEEPLLVLSDLMKIDMISAGLYGLLYFCKVSFSNGAAHDSLRNLIFSDTFCHFFVMLRNGEFGQKRPGESCNRPLF